MILILNDTPNYPNRTIGAYRIATALREQGIEVEVIDFISRWPWDFLLTYIQSKPSVEWVGISSRFSFEDVFTVSKTGEQLGIITDLKQNQELELFSYFKNKQIPIVVGGPTADIQRPWLVGHADWIIKGYADTAVIALHNHITHQTPLKFYTFKESLKVIDADADYTDWDLANIETRFHETDFVTAGEIFSIEIARGCQFKCSYCNFSHTGKAPGTYIRPMESIKRDIEHRWTLYQGREFNFVDDTFNDSVEKMEQLAELRESSNMPWEFWAYCRLDLLRAQPRQQELVDAIGWKSMTWGIETFNRKSGSAVGKGADPEKLKQFIKEARQRWPDNHFNAHIIVGLPNDTEEQIKETVDWFEANPELVDNVKLMPLMIFNNNDPHGRMHPQAMANNPKAWGYDTTPQLKNGKPIILLHWVTENGMTREDAVRISKEQSKRLNGNKFSVNDFRWPKNTMQLIPLVFSEYIRGKHNLYLQQLRQRYRPTR